MCACVFVYVWGKRVHYIIQFVYCEARHLLPLSRTFIFLESILEMFSFGTVFRYVNLIRKLPVFENIDKNNTEKNDQNKILHRRDTYALLR